MTAAIVTHAVGYGVMRTLDTVLPPIPGAEKGLDAYLSATWGDAILLPTLAAGLTLVIQERRCRSRRLEFLGAAFGLVGGTSVVLSWVLDPHPDVNWTTPAPHQLSAPGWYHGIFLITAATLSGWAFARALTGHRIGTGALARAGATLIVGSVAMFMVLLVLDNANVPTAGARGTLLGMLGALVGLGGLVLLTRRARDEHE